MEHKWNLDSLYKSFEDNKLIDDKKMLKELLEDNVKWANENLEKLSTKVLEEVISRSRKSYALFDKLFNFGQLSFSTNVKDEKAMKLIEFCENLLGREKEFEVAVKEGLKKCDSLEAVIDTSEILKEHKFYLLELKDETRYMLSREEELAIEKMKNSGSRAWEKLQDTLTSTLQVPYETDGKKEILNLSAIRNMAYDPSQEVRRKAYEAELKSYKGIETSIASALNSIKQEALSQIDMRGYESILEATLKKSRLKKETLDSMLEAMTESLEDFAKYLRRKGEMLGHEKGLPFYDLFAPVGEAELKFTEAEAKEFILENFYKFSDRLGNMAARAFEEAWVDFNPREGKVGGAFCSNIHSIGQSRILSNFTGSFSDVLTLAHELGHGYHGETLKDESILNSDYTMPIAETASIFCETIVKNAVLEKADDKSKITILEQDISDSLQVIVDIYSRFLFEDKVISERRNGFISSEKLREYMLESQKKAYLNGLDHEYLHEYMWVCKVHYYSADLNYYNFPYAFGLLFSKGLYVKYLEDKEGFVEKYDELLAMTGKNSIEDVAKFMDIDVTKKEFWQASLALVKKDIELFIQLTK